MEVIDAPIAESSAAPPATQESQPAALESVTTEKFTPEERNAWLKEGKVPSSKNKAASTPAGDSQAPPAESTQGNKETEARFNELLKDRKEAREENARLAARLEALEKGEKPAPPAKAQPKEADGPPKRMKAAQFIEANPGKEYDDFDDYKDQHTQALIDYRFKQHEERLKSRETEQASQQEKAAVNKVLAERMSRAMKTTPDFVPVVTSPELTKVFSTVMDKFCVEADVDGKIQYYLGKHLDEAAHIFEMTPIGQARALGKLELKLYPEVPDTPPPAQKKVSAASPPPTLVSGTSSVIEDEGKAALAAHDFRRFKEIEDAKDLARAGRR